MSCVAVGVNHNAQSMIVVIRSPLCRNQYKVIKRLFNPRRRTERNGAKEGSDFRTIKSRCTDLFIVPLLPL